MIAVHRKDPSKSKVTSLKATGQVLFLRKATFELRLYEELLTPLRFAWLA